MVGIVDVILLDPNVSKVLCIVANLCHLCTSLMMEAEIVSEMSHFSSVFMWQVTQDDVITLSHCKNLGFL
jgi:hypothetical protein